MAAANQAVSELGVAPACAALGVPRASFYRSLAPVLLGPPEPRPASPRALSAAERQTVLDVLHEPRFADQAPAEVQTALLDEGVYHCSTRTMYRLLAAENEVHERRRITRRTGYARPELLATAPNQVWSWDITKLLGPVKWTYFYLYVIIDIFSRYVVGWMVAHRESAAYAQRLIAESCEKQNIKRDQLILHADCGGPMKALTTAQKLADLGVLKSHSRPYVSDDNPFSESQFKTMKYRPEFPERFGCQNDALAFCRVFFDWYNREHHHSGIAMLTPAMVHYGQAAQIIEARGTTLTEAWRLHPERFVRRPPRPAPLPTAVYINPPRPAARDKTATVLETPGAVEPEKTIIMIDSEAAGAKISSPLLLS